MHGMHSTIVQLDALSLLSLNLVTDSRPIWLFMNVLLEKGETNEPESLTIEKLTGCITWLDLHTWTLPDMPVQTLYRLLFVIVVFTSGVLCVYLMCSTRSKRWRLFWTRPFCCLGFSRTRMCLSAITSSTWQSGCFSTNLSPMTLKRAWYRSWRYVYTCLKLLESCRLAGLNLI